MFFSGPVKYINSSPWTLCCLQAALRLRENAYYICTCSAQFKCKVTLAEKFCTEEYAVSLAHINKVLWRLEALQLHYNKQSHWSSGSTICFLPRGSSSHAGDAPTLTMEPGSPVSDVLLHLWPQCDPRSQATIGSLCSQSHDDLSHACTGSTPFLFFAGPPPPPPLNTVID